MGVSAGITKSDSATSADNTITDKSKVHAIYRVCPDFLLEAISILTFFAVSSCGPCSGCRRLRVDPRMCG